jgi:uncharacterized protein (DUF1697 family)
VKRPGKGLDASTTWIALLRGVNVGGNRKIAMADLRALFEALGFDSPATLLQSGNVVFRSLERDREALAERLRVESERRLGLKTTYLLRTSKEWAALVARNPFPDEARSDPSHLLLFALTSTATAEAIAELTPHCAPGERLAGAGGELYVYYGGGIADSKLDNARIDRRLGGCCTGRNWNTVRKLAALAGVGTAAS